MGFSGEVTFGSNPNYGQEWFSVMVNSTAFTIAGREVRWYGILIGIGMLCALLYAFCYCKRFGIDSDRMIDVVIVGVIAGVIGARAYYVAFDWQEYAGGSFWDMIDITNGGLAIYGAIIFGLGFGALTCKLRKVRILPMLDLASIGFLIGQAWGRWGNFTNQEAFGYNTSLPWGMYSSNTYNFLQSIIKEGVENLNPMKPVHPCFLYESLWCIIGFVLLHLWSKRRQYDGQIFLMYVFWYGLGRFFIEGLRTDSLMFGPYRISRLLAGALAIISLILLFLLRKRRSVFGEDGLKRQLEEEKRLLEEKKAKKNDKEAVPLAETAEENKESADIAAENETEQTSEVEENSENKESVALEQNEQQ